MEHSELRTVAAEVQPGLLLRPAQAAVAVVQVQAAVPLLPDVADRGAVWVVAVRRELQSRHSSAGL